jgi:CDP-paratose 2-epimerase
MTMSGTRRRVLIFGGAGFVGCNLADRLLNSGDATVHIYDNLQRPGASQNLEWLKQHTHRDLLTVTLNDVRNAHAVAAAVADADEVYHFAAQVAVTSSLMDPRYDFEVNTLGTLNVLEGARLAGHRPFMLFTSTNKVYGDVKRTVRRGSTRYLFENGGGISEEQPLDFHSPYGCSKGAADQYVRDYARIYGLRTVVLRMSCIAGPHQHGNEDQGWVAHFLISALTGKPMTIYGDGLQVRDVLAVSDLLNAIESVRNHLTDCSGEIYNIGGGQQNSVSLLELINLIQKMTACRMACSFAPMRPGDQLVYVTDHSKLTRHTGWRPTRSVVDTLQEIKEWLDEGQLALKSPLPFAALVPSPELAG